MFMMHKVHECSLPAFCTGNLSFFQVLTCCCLIFCNLDIINSTKRDKDAIWQDYLVSFSCIPYKIKQFLAGELNKLGGSESFLSSLAILCKFGNFRKDFIFAKLRICEVLSK